MFLIDGVIMDRRSFIKQSSFIIPGLTAAAVFGTTTRKLFAENTGASPFSLSVVTDRPQEILPLIQRLLEHSDLPETNIRYTEYILHGNHISDIVYARSGVLMDYRSGDEPLAAGLREIAKLLDMPYACKEPLLAHFSCAEGIRKPAGIRIFRDNQLVVEKSFSDRSETIRIEGPQGPAVLELSQNHTLRFLESPCRHKTCMSSGSISQAGQNLVCIPNRISAVVTGTDISGVDSRTY
jgi:hypothetical protein